MLNAASSGVPEWLHSKRRRLSQRDNVDRMKYEAVNIAQEIPAPTLTAFFEAPHDAHEDDPNGLLDDECETCRPIVESGLLTLVPID